MGSCPRTKYCHVKRRCERRQSTENRPEGDVHPAEIRDVISRLDDRLPIGGDGCEESSTKPSLSEDVFQQKHPATLEARLEKLEEYCMRPVGNQPTRERLLSLRLLDGSSRKADDPLALATERLLFEPYPKMFWDKLDISDQDDLKTPATIRGRRISLFSGNSCCELLYVEEKSLNMVKPTKMVVWVEIARRHGPHGEMRCGGTVHITANVTTTVITMRELTATNCKDDTREKIAGRSSIRHNRLRKFVESVKPIKKALSRLSIREEETE
ncbi:Adenylosuccinate synthetase [Trichinella spiralis]|uniref:Adenylosuccinate synthetase n=1 Tax=Trichinella spiralis TaxID=6334 RepID=A0ABR3KHL5_TRISP